MTINKAAFLFLLLPNLLSAESLNSIFEGSPRSRAFPLLVLQENKPKDGEIETWLEDLGDEDGIKRETATDLLFKNFKHAKEKIEKRLDKKGDPEVQGRLRWILKEAPRDPRARELERKLPSTLRDIFPPGITDKVYSKKEEDLAEVLKLVNKSRFNHTAEEIETQPLTQPIADHLLRDVPDWRKLQKQTKSELLLLLLISNGADKIDAVYGPPLLNLLTDQEDWIRRDALQVINWKIPLKKEEMRKIAVKMLNDPNEHVVSIAIRTLAKHEIKEEKERVLALRHHPSPHVLFNCFEYFEELFEKGPEAVSIGEQMLRNLPEPKTAEDGRKYKDAHGLSNVMNAFNDWGILKNYIPELQKIADDPELLDSRAASAWLKQLSEKK